MLPGSQLSVLVQRLPGGERSERNGGGRQMIHRSGLGGQVGGGSGDVLGGGAGAVEADQAVDLVAGLPAVGVRAGRGHDPRQVMAGNDGPALRPGQFVGRDRGGADLHEQFPRPRIGDGDALTGHAGRIGARCAHGAHRTDGVVHGSCPSCAQGSSPGSADELPGRVYLASSRWRDTPTLRGGLACDLGPISFGFHGPKGRQPHPPSPRREARRARPRSGSPPA